MRQVQSILRQVSFVQLKFPAAANCDLPVREIWEFAKAFHLPKQALIMTKRVTHDGSFKIGDLLPGSIISFENFESRLLGPNFNSWVYLC